MIDPELNIVDQMLADGFTANRAKTVGDIDIAYISVGGHLVVCPAKGGVVHYRLTRMGS